MEYFFVLLVVVLLIFFASLLALGSTCVVAPWRSEGGHKIHPVDIDIRHPHGVRDTRNEVERDRRVLLVGSVRICEGADCGGVYRDYSFNNF